MKHEAFRAFYYTIGQKNSVSNLVCASRLGFLPKGAKVTSRRKAPKEPAELRPTVRTLHLPHPLFFLRPRPYPPRRSLSASAANCNSSALRAHPGCARPEARSGACSRVMESAGNLERTFGSFGIGAAASEGKEIVAAASSFCRALNQGGGYPQSESGVSACSPASEVRVVGSATCCLPSSASLGWTDYSQVGMLGLRYISVNYVAGKSPGLPTW